MMDCAVPHCDEEDLPKGPPFCQHHWKFIEPRYQEWWNHLDKRWKRRKRNRTLLDRERQILMRLLIRRAETNEVTWVARIQMEEFYHRATQ